MNRRESILPLRGFSLVEILVTLAVIMMVVGMLFVNFGGVTKAERLRAASRHLAGMSDFVRSVATGSKRPAFLDIDFDRHRYRFRMEPAMDEFGRYVDLEEERLLTEEEVQDWRENYPWDALPNGVYFRKLWKNSDQFYEKGTIEVEYRANGTLNTYVLWLQTAPDTAAKDGLWYSIMVNGLSGKSEVLDDKIAFAKADESDFKSVMGTEIPGGDGK